MVGSSRCIAATLFKFGGPSALPQPTRSLCVRTGDSRFLTLERSCVAAEILSALENISSLEQTLLGLSEMQSLCLPVGTPRWWAQVRGREAAASFVAVAQVDDRVSRR